jgi:hypothetical protein
MGFVYVSFFILYDFYDSTSCFTVFHAEHHVRDDI